MRVKNKITGKLANLTLSSDEKTFLIIEDGEASSYTAKLADLKDWEEVAEECWHIDFDGILMRTSDIKCDKYVFDNLKEIGNYFDTREEAEKAVEKLKAVKRLKDKGFRFDGYHIPAGEIHFNMEIPKDSLDEIAKDMDVCFGGEE